MELPNCEPEEVVMDGSSSIYGACISVYGGFSAISCYFHVMKLARKAKTKADLPKSLWLEMKKDLALLSDSVSRTEWEKLAELLVKKWKEDKG